MDKSTTRIVVADDDPVSRGLIRDVLEPQSYEVFEASNGEEALRMIAETRPDLVLLDIQMPVLDGYEVLKKLRSDVRFCYTPVAFITALAMTSDRARALSIGSDAYITKPINVSALRAQVQTLLQLGERARKQPSDIIET
jgi:two-component system cell cycle response regulator DivK